MVSFQCLTILYYILIIYLAFSLHIPITKKQNKINIIIIFCLQKENRALTLWVEDIFKEAWAERSREIHLLFPGNLKIVINVISEALQGEWGCVRTDSVMTQVWCNEENGTGSRMKLLVYSCGEVEELHSLSIYSCVFTHPCVIPAFPAL